MNFRLILIILVLVVSGKPVSHSTPFKSYAVQAASSSLAMYCSFLALEHLDYPTQVLGKSCKPIPVMLMGIFILRRRYSLFKYAYVALITGGIAWFMLEDVRSITPSVSESAVSLILSCVQNRGRSREAKEENLMGYALLLGSLLLDGVTGPFQERLVHQHKPTSYHLMMNSNIWGAFFLGIGTPQNPPANRYSH
jgi:solute carrier family 35 (UDP-galactose transporter), member B1